ncbi:MAG: restriction endonuclease [Phycisphaeraceae bacterium]|nr:MAG: restriction endonuclease [Phycisphaeraceae bacterium]
MIYNFRIDRSEAEAIASRIRNDGILSQGWGGGSPGDLDLRRDDFVQKCAQRYDLTSERVPNNLARIRELKRGDVLVTPHMPEYGKVAMHVVADDFPDCYEHLTNDDTHQNHRLRISKSFGMGGNVSIRCLALTTWYSKIQWLRYPVLPIPQYETGFRGVMDKLSDEPTYNYSESSIVDYLEKLRGELAAKIRDDLKGIRPSATGISFESICVRLLESAGYSIVRRNCYDSEGGDADFVCTRSRAEVSPFELGESLLCVQVKKHEGTTGKHAVEQVIGIMKSNPGADGCVMALADSFDGDAIAIAEKNGICLITGDLVCGLLMAELVSGLKVTA